MGRVARVTRRGCSGRHLMVRSVAVGLFVCAVCGQVAACPGCVDAADGMKVHLCAEHAYMAYLDGMASRTVWATEESAR